MKVSLTLQLYIQCSFPPNKSKAFSLMVFQKGDEKLSFCTALQIQYRYSSCNLAHASWKFWYLIYVWTTIEKCVVFFSLKRSYLYMYCICNVVLKLNISFQDYELCIENTILKKIRTHTVR